MTDRPPVPHFHPSRLVLVLTRHEGQRGLVVSCPHLPAWQVTARGPVELAHRVDEGFRELGIRAYAEARDEEYDLTELSDLERPAATGDPWAWREIVEGPDRGKWLSPRGRKYRPDAAVVGKVLAGRLRKPRKTASF